MKKKGGDGQNTQYTKIIYDEDRTRGQQDATDKEDAQWQVVSDSVHLPSLDHQQVKHSSSGCNVFMMEKVTQ